MLPVFLFTRMKSYEKPCDPKKQGGGLGLQLVLQVLNQVAHHAVQVVEVGRIHSEDLDHEPL